jgi:pimeloyl-ACP methyl ester carboxylesterase
MAELADRHARLLDQLFGEPVDLIGISTGGVIAMQLAVDHRRVIKRLIVGAAAAWLGEEGRIKLARYGESVARGRSGARIIASVLMPRALEWLATPVFWMAHRLEKSTDPSDMLATIDAEVGFDVRPRLAEIRTPILFIAGGRDRAFPLPLVDATAAAISGSRLIVYPRAGHIGTMMDRRFGNDVASFLAAGG